MTGIEFVASALLPSLALVLAAPLVMALIPLVMAQALVTRLDEGPRAARQTRALNDSLMLHSMHVGIAEMNERLDRVERSLVIEKGELA